MLDVAIEAVRTGAQVSLKYFRHIPKVSYKPDNSPVTIADKTTEKVIRSIISRKFPDHGIIGEEHPPINPGSQYRWVIDPIDGTKQYIRRIPNWGSFIGLLKDNKPVLGVIYYPCFGEMYTAQKGQGAYLNGKRVRVSKVGELKNATMGHGTIKRFEKHQALEGLIKLDREIYSTINLGPYTIGQLVRGHIDINIDGGGSIWDFVAPSIIVEEAGGKFTDFKGKKSFTSNNCVLTNGILHDQVVKLLNS